MNLRNMRRICGSDSERKLHLLMEYSRRQGDIADPWYTGDFERTWKDVLEGCRELLASGKCCPPANKTPSNQK